MTTQEPSPPFATAVARMHAAMAKVANGDISGIKALYAHSDDATSFYGWGGYEKGWDAVSQRWDWAGRQFKGGTVSYQNVATVVTAELADTTLLIQPPGLGDGVQAVKAGIMEVPGIFVINKADLPGARQAASEIRQYLELVDAPEGQWTPPVLLAKAADDRDNGVPEVWQAVQAHWAFLKAGDRLGAGRAERARQLIWKEADRLLAAALRRGTPATREAGLLESVGARRLAPHEAARALVEAFLDQRPE